jgi:hypothetical protein
MSDQNESSDIRITGDEFRAALAACASFKLERKVLVAEIEGLALIDEEGSSFGFIAEEAKKYEIDIIMFDQAEVEPEAEEEAAVVVAELGPEDLVYQSVGELSDERELPGVADAGLTAGQYAQFLGHTTFAGHDTELLDAVLQCTAGDTEDAPPWVELDSEEPTTVTAEQYVEASAADFTDDEIFETSADVIVEDNAEQVRSEAAKRGWETRRRNQAAKEEVKTADVPAEAVAVVAEVEDIAEQTRILALAFGNGPSEYEEHVKAETEAAPAQDVDMGQRANDMRALLARLRK